MLSAPRSRRTSAISASCSAACVCSRAPRCDAQRRPRAAAPRCTTGRSAARRRSAAGRRRRRASARRARRSRRSSGGWPRASAPARRRRRPSSPCRWWRVARWRRRASKSASVSWTVPMSRMAVVPPRSSSATARRGAGAHRALVERRLVRPDALAQPLEQRQVVGGAAAERLAQVRVRLHQARQHEAARRVDALCARITVLCARITVLCARITRLMRLHNFHDAAVLDDDVAAHDPPRGIHRDDGAAFDDEPAHVQVAAAERVRQQRAERGVDALAGVVDERDRQIVAANSAQDLAAHAARRRRRRGRRHHRHCGQFAARRPRSRRRRRCARRTAPAHRRRSPRWRRRRSCRSAARTAAPTW